ncbi:MAG: type II secretion system F family protein [Solirubrobacteraceae bacterium]
MSLTVVWLLASMPASAAASQVQAASQASFWVTTAGKASVSVICALLLAAAVTLAFHRPPKQGVRDRVGSFVPQVPDEAEAEEDSPVAEPRAGNLAKRIARTDWWLEFAENVEVGRNPRTPVALVRRAAGIGIFLSLLLIVASGSSLLGMLPLIGWPFVLRVLVNRAAEKQRTRFRDTLPTYLQDLASAMRVGRSFAGGLAIVADGAEEPTRSELERAVTDETLGRPLEESLEAVSRRMRSNDMDQVALIAGLNRRSGSNVSEALDRVAEGARDRNDLRREMKALTSQAKMSSYILTGLPGVLLLGLSVISPAYAHPMFHTTVGIAALVFGSVLVAIGWKVMQKITKIPT